MGDEGLTITAKHLAVLEQRVCWYRYLSLGLGVLILLGVSLAAQTSSPAPTVVRATRFEVVDEAGQVVFTAEAHQGGGALHVWNTKGQPGLRAYATDRGGRVEVLDHEGKEIFSAGTPSGAELSGLWERQRRALDQQQRHLDQQRQEITHMGRMLSALEPRDHPGSELERLERAVEQQRRELDQLRRELDQQRRQSDAVERQLRFLERR